MSINKKRYSQIRIGFVNEYFPPFDIGGAEWSTYYLGKNLAKMGNAIFVITPNYGTFSYEAKDGIRIYRFWVPQRLKSGKMLRAILRENPLFHLYSALKIWWVIEVKDIEVLHIQNYQLLPGAIIAARLKGIPTVITIRDYALVCPVALCLRQNRILPEGCNFLTYLKCLRHFNRDFYQGRHIFYQIKFYIDGIFRWINLALLKYSLNKVDLVIVTSRSMEETYRPLLKIKPTIIYNPVDFDNLPDASFKQRPRKCILYAGRLTRAKGVDLLFEALSFLSPEVGEIEIIFAGEGPLKEELQKKATALKKGSFVTFLGKLEHQKLLKLYKEVDLVVVPSRWHEPFGRVCLEALANGTPVVATNKGALPELIEDGVTGRIVEPNPKVIAEAIESVLNSNVIYENVRFAMPQLKEKFLDDVIKQHRETYEKLLNVRYRRPILGKLGHYLTIFRNIIINKFYSDECERMILQARKKNKKRILFGYVKGIGDIALSIYGFVQYVRTKIPGAEVSAIVRPGLEEAIILIKDVKHILVAQNWRREDSFLMKPTVSDIGDVLKSKGLFGHFDIIIPSMTRGRWWKKQFNKVRPELEWNKEDEQFGRTFVEGTLGLKDSFRVAIQLATHTAKFYPHNRDWPIEKFKKFITLLTVQPNSYVLLIGLEAGSDIESNSHLIDMRGKTSLKESLSLIVNSHVFIGLDSGLLCLLYYLKNIELTIVSLFGQRHGIFYRNEPPTSKFLRHFPVFGAADDVANIEVDEVYNLVRRLKSEIEAKRNVNYTPIAS